MEDHLSLGMHFQRQAEILRQTGDLKGARDAYLKAADQMLLYAREVQGSKKTSAQDIARKLIEKAKERKGFL